MEVFINECSLNEQFHPYDLADSLWLFIKAIDLINKYNNASFFKSSTIINHRAIKDSHIAASLKSNFNLNSVFFQNLKNATNWEDNQLHDSNSEYVYNKTNYTGTSVAEITERCIVKPKENSILINFVNSEFKQEKQILVIKNKSKKCNVNCAYDEDSIIEWLIKIGIIDPKKEYDVNSGLAPLDQQTVLLNPEFELTKWRNKGRRLYRLKDANQLWAVDSSKRHATEKAHIEVFDESTRKHLGTSIYNKIDLDTSHCIDNRFVDLD